MENEIDAKFTFSVDYPVAKVQQLRRLFSTATQSHFAHLSLSGPGGTLFISKNGAKAWLMFLRYNGDAGFHSINPDYDGPDDVMLEL